MLDNPRVSVIMSVYNGEKYLREAIESILSQTFTGFEFIIVNDGSTDSSTEIVSSYHDKRIWLINNEVNIGLTKSLNKGIKEARGEYIARQDADDISLPNRFEEQIKYFEKHPQIVLLGTGICRIDSNGNVMGSRLAIANPGNSLLRHNQFNHGSTMFKTVVVCELGGYNELFKYCQDYELWLRIAQYYEVRNLPQLLYKLRFHNEAVQLRHAEEALLYRLLALRLARDELEPEILKVIRSKGIKALHSYLRKSESISYRTSLANLRLLQGELKLAREEYKHLFSLAPFNIENNINIIRSYFSRILIIKSYKVYETIRNVFVYFQNLYSKYEGR